MKKIAIISLFLFGLFGNAQQLENSLLWKISGKNSQSTSYLFGTVHAICDYTIPEKVSKAIAETEQLYLELDITNNQVKFEAFKHMKMKDGEKLSNLLSKEDFETVHLFLKKQIGMSAHFFDTYKPFFVGTFLLPKYMDCKQKAVDLIISDVYKSSKKPIFALETVAVQMAVFDAIPYQLQADELLKIAKNNMADEKEMFKKLLKAYHDEKIHALLDISSEADLVTKDYSHLLLDNRNENWIPTIKKALTEKATFFAFGAAHLAGEKGVIELLRKAGYTVTPVFE